MICYLEMKMKNNYDRTFLSIIEMLKNPEEYNDFSVEVMIATIGVINDRILEVDSDILHQQITQEEYDKHYDDVFISSYIELNDIIDNLKYDKEIHNEN